MSQWGAKGQADAGRKAPEILGYYYRGTTLGPAPMPPEVRVGALWDIPSIDITASGPFELRYGSPEGEQLATGAANQIWTVSTDGSGNLILKSADKTITRPGDTQALFVLYANSGSLLRLPQTGNRYKHGVLEIDTYLKGAAWMTRAIVTRLNTQQYLYGLGEVPSSWPEEALKAQAIAARTYGVEKLTRLGQARKPCDCGLYPSTIDQVYVGFEKEGGPGGERWKAAVDATDGQVLTLNGRPIEAVYHSSSGGYTENNEFVWGGKPLPYLRGVPDPWDGGPRRTWSVRLSQDELAARLNANPATAAGRPVKIEILDPAGVSGRVRSVLSDTQGGVRITGTTATRRLSGSALSRALGMFSTLFWQGEPKAAPAGPVTPAAVTEPAPVPAPPPPVAPAPAGVPAGPTGHPNGTLIKGSGPRIYLVQEGKKLPFGSTGALTSRYPKTLPVQLSDEQLKLYPDGPPIGYRDGTMLTYPGPAVWLISDGQRRRFASADALNHSGYPRAQMRKVTRAEVELHPEGPPIKVPSESPYNGTVVKGSGPTVFLIEAGQKRPVPSMKILESRFTWKDVVKVKDSALARFPAGPAVGFAEGNLIKDPDGAIFVISDQKRRLVSPEKFAALGFQSARVRAVTGAEAQVHPLGEPL